MFITYVMYTFVTIIKVRRVRNMPRKKLNRLLQLF